VVGKKTAGPLSYVKKIGRPPHPHRSLLRLRIDPLPSLLLDGTGGGHRLDWELSALRPAGDNLTEVVVRRRGGRGAAVGGQVGARPPEGGRGVAAAGRMAHGCQWGGRDAAVGGELEARLPVGRSGRGRRRGAWGVTVGAELGAWSPVWRLGHGCRLEVEAWWPAGRSGRSRCGDYGARPPAGSPELGRRAGGLVAGEARWRW
jgi:hypothetical protein